uniref:Exonuclease domain-containing protein n=1 Tax=Glossina austeni TaxID=7395 RepID=A0A1A9UWI8_GLOAU
MKRENFPTNTILFKNIPKQITNVEDLLKSLNIPAKQVKPFGRKRVLITYEDADKTEEALDTLKSLEINEKLCNVSLFTKEKINVNEKVVPKTKKILKINRLVQTSDYEYDQLNTAGESRKPPVTPVKINKELGLIQTIYVDGAQADNNNSSSKTSKSKLLQQTYDYVICVDFEATCWENQAPPRWRESEIIEFPAVLVNLKTGKIEAEFHKYIMPIESPKLSAFCTKLTGIAQKTVDNGIPLQTALMMFQEWLRKELRARHLSLPKMTKDNKLGNCAFVSWTDWDFGICLHKECSRKRLKKPPYFNQWIDLRAIYKKWYKYQPLNFADALRHVGLSFQGREHSGIDDAKNLAGLAYKLIKDGATLAITQDLTPFQLNLNCVL